MQKRFIAGAAALGVFSALVSGPLLNTAIGPWWSNWAEVTTEGPDGSISRGWMASYRSLSGPIGDCRAVHARRNGKWVVAVGVRTPLGGDAQLVAKECHEQLKKNPPPGIALRI